MFLFRLIQGSRIQGKKFDIFWFKNCNCLIPRPPKRESTPSALKTERTALQNIKFLNFFLILWVIFALLDPDPDPLSWLNLDPKHCSRPYVMHACSYNSTHILVIIERIKPLSNYTEETPTKSSTWRTEQESPVRGRRGKQLSETDGSAWSHHSPQRTWVQHCQQALSVNIREYVT